MEKRLKTKHEFPGYDLNKSLIVGKKAAMTLLQQALEVGNFQVFSKNVKEQLKMLNETDMKAVLEYIFRQVLLTTMIKKRDMAFLERVFKFSIEAAISDLCSGNIAVLILGDMFDCSTIADCEKIFTFVENSAEVFKTDALFKTCKNHLLRSCNDLLRRLSRSQNTVFCGRILLFLARIFPFSERSGLNIISEFNLDNATKICPSWDELDQTVDKYKDSSDSSTKPKTDYNLYRKFWCLQDYFRNPPLCYNKLQWRHFQSYTNEILTIFGSFKADNIPPLHSTSESGSNCTEFTYFAKYLTSPKLLELELCDSKFRRCVLIQFLIIFQYLLSPVKFKLETYVLTEEQILWVNETTEKVCKCLAETPPDGEAFCEVIKKLLEREEYWNKWKNEGCPGLKPPAEPISTPEKPRVRLSDLHNQLGKINLGSNELNRLWNICPDNWEACRSPRRNFMPSLEKYFENAIKQIDPSNKVPSEEKDVNDPNFCWKGLLLLSKKSPLFFSVNNIPYKTTADYLEATIQRFPKESSTANDTDSSEPLARENYEDGNDEMLQTHDGDDSSTKEDEPDAVESESAAV